MHPHLLTLPGACLLLFLENISNRFSCSANQSTTIVKIQEILSGLIAFMLAVFQGGDPR